MDFRSSRGTWSLAPIYLLCLMPFKLYIYILILQLRVLLVWVQIWCCLLPFQWCRPPPLCWTLSQGYLSMLLIPRSHYLRSQLLVFDFITTDEHPVTFPSIYKLSFVILLTTIPLQSRNLIKRCNVNCMQVKVNFVGFHWWEIVVANYLLDQKQSQDCIWQCSEIWCQNFCFPNLSL